MEKILQNFYLKFPKLYSREIAIKKNKEKEKKYKKLLSKKIFDFKDFKIKEINYIDGIKFIFSDSWLLLRESGTSEVFRVYAESTISKKTENLIKLGRSLIE